jgi:choline dehydrogenase-like flavoprotein
MVSRNVFNLVLCAVAVAAQDYDYLVVGAGAAGALIAGKLATNGKDPRVGVIEAGLFQEQDITLVPGMPLI